MFFDQLVKTFKCGLTVVAVSCRACFLALFLTSKLLTHQIMLIAGWTIICKLPIAIPLLRLQALISFDISSLVTFILRDCECCVKN